MEKNCLSSIERELVVQYLIDGNIPVTVTPEHELYKENDEVQPLTSAIFPVALKPEYIKTEKNGKILLENPPQSVQGFKSKRVKVEFYFNRVGLYFYSIVKSDKRGLYLSIPNEILRIQEVVENIRYDFKALVYFDFYSKKDTKFECIPWKYENLFSRPVWKSIPLENQKIAKQFLESFVEQAKIEKNAGNGIQLIPVCNYLTMDVIPEMQSLQNRKSALNILYVDHERIVLGYEGKDANFSSGQEFGLKFSFSLKNGPIISRDIFLTGVVNKVYENKQKDKYCVDICYTSLQEEDLRYIYEKATKTILI